jgi:hypothetical protein
MDILKNLDGFTYKPFYLLINDDIIIKKYKFLDDYLNDDENEYIYKDELDFKFEIFRYISNHKTETYIKNINLINTIHLVYENTNYNNFVYKNCQTILKDD